VTLLSLDFVSALPDAEPRKKGLLARTYGVIYRSRMARAEALEQYRPLFDDLDKQAKASRAHAFTID
jgi:hypothetical protein